MFLFSFFWSGCPPLVYSGGLRFGNPVHYYAAWAIAVCAVCAVFLPFLKGYRLGGHVTYYSLDRHLILTLVLALFPVAFALISPYPLSFGSSLLDLFYLPFYILIDILSSSLSFELPEILGLLAGLSAYLLYCMVAAWIMLRLDRWLYKKQSTVNPGIK